MKLLHELTLQSTYEELEKVEDFLNALQNRLEFGDDLYARLMLTVSEAATNGVVHGNQLDESKTVNLKAFLDPEESKLIIESKDEGSGFNPEEVPDPLAEENLLKPSGRGVFLMDEYADETRYFDEGTRLRMVFNLSS